MLQMAEMRALEFGRSVVFVGNDGITAIIGPDGNIEESVPPHEMAVLSGTVERMGGSTPWMRTGMDPILFIMLCLFLAARFHCRERKPILTHENAKQTNRSEEHTSELQSQSNLVCRLLLEKKILAKKNCLYCHLWRVTDKTLILNAQA